MGLTADALMDNIRTKVMPLAHPAQVDPHVMTTLTIRQHVLWELTTMAAPQRALL
jgi:hypothetical protein